jgi:2-polyprenyl-6-hydroxyphenyl methylase/3-demethylubiquinone-9 3-methyltransferase
MSTHKSFTEDASKWLDPQGPFWTLHAINPIRLSFILQYIQSGKALDIGCGGGILSDALSSYFETLGIDTDENLIQVAKEHNTLCQYRHCTSSDIVKDYPDNFDLITCLEVLEHTKNPEHIIKDISHMLKPGGFAFVSTLNRNLISFLGAIILAEHVLEMIPKNTHEYEYLIKPSELIQWAQAYGLRLVDLKGIGYNPLNQTFSLCNHTAINYIACFEKI